MTSDSANTKSIFMAAIEKRTPDQWPAFLDDACGDDAALRGRVEELLRAHVEMGSIHASDPEATCDPCIAEQPGTQIGPYKLLQQIGEGGMGTVYMAEQTEPVQRRVALKVIKRGMDSRQVIARFEAERQALAMMDHPNIAKVLDAGTTESGRPYFVMELVNGIAITKYCDEQHLTPKERLELFIPICQAIQHAHQKGIIHRDLKPSNVLIALYDGVAVPKVIDFGVAKATSQNLTEKTLFTQLGQVVGTLEYMSPEQAQRNQLDIDTRSDIYSLGVLLYELLTGATPFDRQRLRTAAFDEMLRIIREEEPPRPSFRLSTIDTLPSVAANRKIEPKKLSTLVRGELDWIVMKALEKDRARRYETTAGFASDIRRYLNDEAVVACPPSRAYRFRKFARRNKVTLSATTAVVAALILGMVGTTWQMFRAIRAECETQVERDLAKEERDKALLAQENAKTEAAIAQAVNDFVNDDLLQQANPDNEPDREIKLRAVVDRAAENMEGRFAEQPLVEAAIRQTLGSIYGHLGEYEKQRVQYERAEALRRQLLGPEHPDTLKSVQGRANAISGLGRYAEAEELHREVLETRRRVLGPEHPDTLRSMGSVAADLCELRRYAEAEELHREVLETRRRVLGPEHPESLKSMHDLAVAIAGQNRIPEAEGLFRELLDIHQRVQGPEHPETLDSKCNLARAVRLQGRYDEAEELCRETLETQRRVLGREHRQTCWSMRELATVYFHQRRYQDAVDLDKALLEISQRVLAPQDPDTLDASTDLANTCALWCRKLATAPAPSAQNIEKALALANQATELRPDDHLVALNRVQLLVMTNRIEEYGQACGEMLSRFSQSEDVRQLHVVTRACVLAPNAVPDPTLPVELAKRAVSEDPSRGWLLYALGMAHLRAGQIEESARRFHESLDTDPRWEARYLNWYGLALVDHERGEPEEARQSLDTAVGLMEQSSRFASDHIEGQLLRREAERLLGESVQKKRDVEHSQKE